MTRKQMIEAIAKDAGCSKRLVRKTLFNRYLELKKYYPEILFYKTFLNKNTDWIDYNEDLKNWDRPNAFDVSFFPSGCVVLFHNIDRMHNDEIEKETIGAKLYSW